MIGRSCVLWEGGGPVWKFRLDRGSITGETGVSFVEGMVSACLLVTGGCLTAANPEGGDELVMVCAPSAVDLEVV